MITGKSASSYDQDLAAHVRRAMALLEDAHTDVCMFTRLLDFVGS